MLRRNSNHYGYGSAEALDDAVDLRAMHRISRERYPFLLESTASNPGLGRYDILFACPGDALVLNGDGTLDGGSADLGFLRALDEWASGVATRTHETGLPFLGGWFVYLGYELAGEIEPRLDMIPDCRLPTAFAVRCQAAIIRDNAARCCWLVVEDDADVCRQQIHTDIARVAGMGGRPAADRLQPGTVAEDDPAAFLEAVLAAKRHIADGDIYQANLSRGWSVGFDTSPAPVDVFAALANANPGPFAGLAAWKDVTIVSSSPERLLRIREGAVSTRPIAGTRPRSANRAEDDKLSAELFSNAKERAEHVMLIDLERNDLGRICEAGSVHVDEMMVLESYAHVHHIVSNVRGRLRADITPGAAIGAVFPGGTITGCPKVRCMQIIRDLEEASRGAYTGSFGYLNRDGSLDLNILIRTMVLGDGDLSFRAGSGIVADSDPRSELAETRAKAKGMLEALRQ